MVDKCMVANSVTKRMVMSASRIKNMYVVDLDSIDCDDFSCLSSQADDTFHDRGEPLRSNMTYLTSRRCYTSP